MELVSQPLPGLPAVRPGADAQFVVRPRDVQFVEEQVGHLAVVVLAGVDEDLLVLTGQGLADRRGLDELRPRADDGDDLQGIRPVTIVLPRTRRR